MSPMSSDYIFLNRCELLTHPRPLKCPAEELMNPFMYKYGLSNMYTEFKLIPLW